MALFTKLYINEIQSPYLVVDFRFHYERSHDGYRPISSPTCERMLITIIAPQADDFLFYEWFINQDVLSGHLAYELPVTTRNAYPEERTIGFVEAKCLAISEHYDIRQNSRRLLTLEVIPEQVQIDEMDINHL